MARFLQYQSKTGPQITSFTERTTPDKWQPQTNTPEANFRKLATYSLAAISPAVFFVSLGQPERTQVDKWHKPASEPIRIVQRAPNFAPAFVPIVSQTESVTVDKWYQQTQAPLVKPNTAVFAQPVTPTQDPTSMRPNQIWVEKLQTTNQFLFFPDVKRWQHLYPPFANSVQALTVSERITPDKWQPETNKPLFDLKRQQAVYPSTFFNPNPLPVSTFLNLWHTQAPLVLSPAKPLAHLYPFFTTDPSSLTQKETVSLDRFQQPQSLPRWDFTRNQFVYPFLSFNSQPIGTPATFISAAVQPQSQPLFDVKRWQRIYPTFWPSPYPLGNSETIRADKWHPRIEQPLFDVKRWQHLYLPYATDQKHLLDKEPTFLKWFRETQQPFFIPEQHRYIRDFFAQYVIPHPWKLVDRSTDASYSQVSRSSDASYNPVNRSSNNDWNLINREA